MKTTSTKSKVKININDDYKKTYNKCIRSKASIEEIDINTQNKREKTCQ